MWYHMNGYGWGGMWGMALLWVLLAVVIAFLLRWATRRSDASVQKEKTALDILKERYARGEIEREEFEQKKRDLES